MSDKASSGKEYGDQAWRDESVLRELYVEQEMTVREVGDELGCSPGTVSKHLAKTGISAREGTPGNGDRLWRDESLLRELHNGKGLTQREIADMLGCAHRTVGVWLSRHGIEPHDSWRTAEKNDPDCPWTNSEVLHNHHIRQEQSLAETADELGCSPKTVRRWLDAHSIPQRRYHTRTADFLHDEDEMRHRYVGCGLTLSEIAEEAGCAQKTAWNWLTRHGIETRAIEGENHPGWKGGLTRDYGPSWPDQREAAVQRDGNECQVCGISGQTHSHQYDTGLHVHHLQRFGLFESPAEANRLENLVTLCCSCHAEAERIAPLLPDIR